VSTSIMLSTSLCFCSASCLIFTMSAIKLTLWIYKLYLLKLLPGVIVTHLKKVKSLFKSCFTVFEQAIQLPLAKDFFTLLPFCWVSTKLWILWSVLSMWSLSGWKFVLVRTYSVNLLIYLNTIGSKSPTVSDFIWTSTIALSNL
jgi:hypothetical protein